MPWCPNCKSEYPEGSKICSDCNSELVAELSEDKWMLFFQTVNEREAEIVQSIIDSTGIPIIRKDKGAGGYLKVVMGMTNLGIDLYVPEQYLEEAKNLIPPQESKFENKDEEEIVKKSNQIEPRIEKKHKIFSWVYFLYVVIPLVVFLIINFWNNIRELFNMKF